MNNLVREKINNIMVCLPVKVVSVGNNSLLQVEPLIFNELELPIINDVPVYHIGNQFTYIKVKVNSGDHGLCLFSQVDFATYMNTGAKSTGNTSETFNLTNAIYIPLNAWRNGGMEMPVSFDFEIKGNIKIDGNITHTGQLTNTGKVTSNGIVLDTHIHGGVSVGGAKTAQPE